MAGVLRQAFRQQYRTYALRISVIAHVILIVVLSFVVIRSEMQEAEDEIHVEFFRELPERADRQKTNYPTARRRSGKYTDTDPRKDTDTKTGASQPSRSINGECENASECADSR